MDLERAHFLVTQAFEEDEKGNDDEAIELYTQAVELCIKTVSLSLDPFLFFIMSLTDWHLDFPHIIPTHAHINSSSWFLLFVFFHQSNETSEQVLQNKLKQLARQALDRYI